MYFFHNSKVLKSQTAQLWIFLFYSCRLPDDGYISIAETCRCFCAVNKQFRLDWMYCTFNPLNADLNPICHLLTLLGAHHIFHVSRIRVKCTEDTKGIHFLKIKYSCFGRFRLRLCNFEKNVKSVLLSRWITKKENGGKIFFPVYLFL